MYWAMALLPGHRGRWLYPRGRVRKPPNPKPQEGGDTRRRTIDTCHLDRRLFLVDPVLEVVDLVVGPVLCLADLFLHVACGLVGFAFVLSVVLVCQRADRFFDAAFCLVHLSSHRGLLLVSTWGTRGRRGRNGVHTLAGWTRRNPG